MSKDLKYESLLQIYAERKFNYLQKYNAQRATLGFPNMGNVTSYDDFLVSGCSHCDRKVPCCKDIPCGFMPWDFWDLNNPMYLQAILDSGAVAITNIEGLYSIRPSRRDEKENRIVGHNNIDVQLDDPSCVLLDEKKGCMLPPELRPSSALLFSCKNGSGFSAPEILALWYPYQKLLERLFKENNKYPTFEELEFWTIGERRPPATEEQVKKLSKALIWYR